jgi:hypothetical protein
MCSVKNHRLWSLLTIVAAAGCAVAPQKVVPLGQDAFRVSVAAPIFARQADANYKALDAANAFCDQRGEQVLFRESQESGLHSWSPKREELTFLCMRADDPAFLHASLR